MSEPTLILYISPGRNTVFAPGEIIFLFYHVLNTLSVDFARQLTGTECRDGFPLPRGLPATNELPYLSGTPWSRSTVARRPVARVAVEKNHRQLVVIDLGSTWQTDNLAGPAKSHEAGASGLYTVVVIFIKAFGDFSLPWLFPEWILPAAHLRRQGNFKMVGGAYRVPYILSTAGYIAL